MSNASTIKSNVSKKTVESVDDVKRKMSRPPSIHPGRLADVGGITPRYAKEFLERRLKPTASKESKEKSIAASEVASAVSLSNEPSVVAATEVEAAPQSTKAAAPALRQKPVIAQRTPSATQRLVPRALIGVAGGSAVTVKRTPSTGKNLKPQATTTAAPKVEPQPPVAASMATQQAAADLPQEKAPESSHPVETPASDAQPEVTEVAATNAIAAPLSAPSSRSVSAAPEPTSEQTAPAIAALVTVTKKTEVRVGRTLLPRTGGVNVNSVTGKKAPEPATTASTVSFGAIQTAVKPGAALPPRKQSAGAPVRRAPVIVQRTK